MIPSREEGARAILRYHKHFVGVLCPIGHVLTTVCLEANNGYAGSQRHVDLCRHQRGEPNPYDRMAAACCDGDCARQVSA